MENIYDVAVIGGGPAGATFTAELAATMPETKILLVDGAGDGHAKVCGGLLAPDAQKVLAKMNMTLPNSVLADPQIFAVETVDLVNGRVRFYQRHYLNMKRDAFDKWMLSNVPERVEIVRGMCISAVRDGDFFKITVRRGDTQTDFSSRVLVGADGGGSIVRRKFFGREMKQYVALQQWFGGAKVPYYSCVFDKETSPSCSWTMMKDGFSIYGGAFEKDGCRDAFEKQKSRFEKFYGMTLGEPIKTEACLLSSPRRMRDFITGHGGVFLIGEAAGFISASSFEGISSAIISGKILAGAFADGKEPSKILRLYCRRTRGLRLKLFLKMKKRAVLCSPALRGLIMKSGVKSIEK